MFIHKKNIQLTILNHLYFDKQSYNKNNDIQNFYNELITPYLFTDIIGIYMTIN